MSVPWGLTTAGQLRLGDVAAAAPLTSAEERVLAALSEHVDEGLTTEEMAAALGAHLTSAAALRHTIRTLAGRGFIELIHE